MKTHTVHFIPIVIALGFSLSVMPLANAETTENLKPNRYIHRGELTLDTLSEFKAYLIQYPATREIEFVNSPGASQYAFKLFNEYVSIIEVHKMTTFARGYCNSLCASLFLSGEQRYLLPSQDKKNTVLTFHPAFRGNSGIDYQITLQIDKHLQPKNPWLNEKPFFKIYDVKGEDGGVKIYRQAKSGYHVYFQESFGSKLQVLSPHTLDQLGIGVRDD